MKKWRTWEELDKEDVVEAVAAVGRIVVCLVGIGVLLWVWKMYGVEMMVQVYMAWVLTGIAGRIRKGR